MTADGRDVQSDGTHSPAAFYNELASTYHRLYPDWDVAIREQSRALDLLLRQRLGAGPHRILDCAVGIGTQTIGLLDLGHQVAGTDISLGAVSRATSECEQRGLSAQLRVADMRMLPFLDDSFDAVICADNAVAHLLSVQDAGTAYREMGRVARPGGVVIISLRDYEAARSNQLPGTLPQVSNIKGDHSVAFQVWDWLPDGCRYELTHYTLTQQTDSWQVTTRTATMYAFTRAELVDCAIQAGLVHVEWRMPVQTGFFQPVVIASAQA